MKKKKINQPKIPILRQGYEFMGWTTFNWNVCHNQVFRTRREAKLFLLDMTGNTWNELKDYMQIVKVKCIVI